MLLDNKKNGRVGDELMQVLPALSKDQVQKLVAEPKKEDKIYKIGATRAALWYPENTEMIAP
ncbi:MAG: hypothetical protein ACE5IR_28720 [bacterium]